MKPRKRSILLAMIASVAAHLAAAALLLDGEEAVQTAGGAPVAMIIMGNAFEDAAKVGADGAMQPAEDMPETLEPAAGQDLQAADAPAAEADGMVEPAPVETATEPVEVALPTTARSAETAPALEAADAAVLPALSGLSDPQSPIAVPRQARAVPADAVDPPDPKAVAAVEPQRMLETVSEDRPALPEADAVPVPTPRPEYRRAVPESTPVEHRAEKAAKPKERETGKAPAQAKRKKAVRRASSGGSGGAAAADTQRATSRSKASQAARAAGNAAVSNYPGKVASKLRRALRYPREARSRRIRGEVVLSFVVSGNGSVSGVRIARSSGSPILDRAASEAVRRAAPFPPIPAGAGRASWPFSVPLAFTR
ncbi:MAG: hypothetical protein CMJ42_19980 [Phyllobacteriaceae bacterium]|nr:hypothetical protein [Phyllobacteriaceae bacterium]MBA90309.1 hypothetical protein [Phyllobacteriaceae bacterium]